jgi:TonB family protein
VGDYPRARETYVSALHIERVNEGLHSPGQAAIVYKEADALAAMGDFDEANVRHEYAFEVLQRAYGPTSVELVPGIYKLAEWYVATRNVFGARPLYERARDNLERAYGPASPELVPALRGLAETYRYERFPPYAVSSRRQPAMQVSPDAGIAGVGTPAPEIQINRFSEGERALQEVIAILDTDKANQPVEYALAVLDLADWNLLFEKWERAAALYAHVDSLLRTAAKLPESEITQYLGQPTPLYLPLPADPSPPPPDLRAAPKEGYVELTYSLSERGEVEELRTVGSDPEGLMDIGVRKAFRSARFRPALDHGVPIAVPSQTYRHSFSYYPRRAEVRESEVEAVDRGA